MHHCNLPAPLATTGANIMVAFAVLLAIGASGCKPNMAKLREEQGRKISQDGSAAIEAYKKSFESKPKDPVAAYLYALAVEDRSVREEIAERLVKDHPTFAWGYSLKRALMESRGDFEGGIAMGKKAVELAPDETILKAEAAEDAQVLIIEAPGMYKLLAETGGRVEPLTRDFDLFERAGKNKRSKASAFEALAATQERHADGVIIVMLFVRNISDKPIVVQQTTTCWTADGRKIKQLKTSHFPLLGRDNCVTFPNDVAVQPDEAQFIYGLYDLEGKWPAYCVFEKVWPWKVVVKVEPKT